MTLDEIEERISQIAAAQANPQRMRDLENRLRCDFIRHVAETAGGPLATMAWRLLAIDSISSDPWDRKGGNTKVRSLR
ncbi:MAG: hypothetical protein P8180_05050 [Gammaproteobacteria bacterium]|jgi:hypothetical protein